MIPLFVVLIHLAQFVHGAQTNSTTLSHPQPSGDDVPRTILGILSSCAATLLICVWRAIHFDIHYGPKVPFYEGRVGVVIFSPEMVVTNAVKQWWQARRIAAEFDAKGYKWSMTHSFFAEMGGFDYVDEKGHRKTAISSTEFLKLCLANKIANPLITAQEIRDKSKSDVFVKAIFVVHLLWFVIQVFARGYLGFAVTLVELDTVSMAVLALLVLWFWSDKPHSARCPHVFYSPQYVGADSQLANKLKNAWKPGPGCISTLLSFFDCERNKRPVAVNDEIVEANHSDGVIVALSLGVTGLLLGGLHLIAWDFHFPTETEKILWRVASLVLAGGSMAFFALSWCRAFLGGLSKGASTALFSIALGVGIVARVLLVALMLASLRALPPAAYKTIAWTAYIPHL